MDKIADWSLRIILFGMMLAGAWVMFSTVVTMTERAEDSKTIGVKIEELNERREKDKYCEADSYYSRLCNQMYDDMISDAIRNDYAKRN